MAYLNGITIRDGANLDAFSRLRTSNPTTLFESSFLYDLQPLIFEQIVAGGASIAYNGAASMAELTTAGASGSSAAMQSFRFVRYQPGKSQLAKITFVMGPVVANRVTQFGLYDSLLDSGFLFQRTGAALAMVRRSTTSAGNLSVAQADWNLDRLDGTGPSGIVYDSTKATILIMDLQWLGVGRVRIGFDVNGILYYAHQFLNANSLTLVYMTSANLPIGYEIENTGVAGGTTTMDCICAQVASEGGFEDERGLKFSASNGVTTINVSTRRPVLSARLAANLNSQPYYGQVVFENIDVYSAGMFVEIVLNGTLTGAAFAAVDATNSGVERDVAATAISGGIVLDSFYIGTGGGAKRQSASVGLLGKIPFAKNIAGVSDIISVVCTSLGGATATAASLSWREIY